MIRSILVSIFTISCLSSAFADTEFEGSVPLDLVKALLGNPPLGEPKIYSDLSSAFPEIEIPTDFRLMGSIERGYGVAAVYSTNLSGSQAESVLRDALLQSAYLEFEIPGMRGVETGFVGASVNIPQRYNRYCHDSMGFISINYSPKERSGIVTISANPNEDNRSCAAQLAEQQQALGRMGGRQGGLQRYFPKMELPETEPQFRSPFSGMSGWSGSSNSMETRDKLNIDWTIEEVFEHFANQIGAQDWTLDSKSVGSASANAIWTKSPEPGVDLIGTLTVLKTDDESFDLLFQLRSIGGSNSPYNPFFTR